MLSALLSGVACDLAAEDEPMTVACRAQAYRYSSYTGGNRSCRCYDEEFTADESPDEVCATLYDELFLAGYSAGGEHDTEFSFVVAAPGLTCDEITVDPCDNTDY